MSTTDTVLDVLEKNKGEYISGGKLASALGMSRNSVWKAVKNLQEKGYNIGAVTNKGYILYENNNAVSAQSISKFVKSENICISYYDCIDSTNTHLKKMAENGAEEGTVIVAAEQTSGRGRLGRSFSSQKDTGVYFSILLRPDMKPQNALLITTCAAVAVAKAIEKNTDRMAYIKWVNDIFVHNRKVSGILTEASFDLESGKLSYAVLGIGINMYFPEESIPDDIKGIAGGVFDAKPTGDDISRIVADVINNFMSDYKTLSEKHFLLDYISRSYLDGKKVNVIKPAYTKKAEVIGIDDDFRLQVKYEDGSCEFLSSGEVSLRVD